MIVSTVSKYQFIDALRGDFSDEAAEALFDYLEQLSDDIGENIELDPIGFRCEYYELSFKDFADEYLDSDELGADEIIDQAQDCDGFIAVLTNGILVRQ